MNIQEDKLLALMEAYKENNMSQEEVLQQLHQLQSTNLGFATIDNERTERQGFPEVIYCAGKTPLQSAKIFAALAQREGNVLATRADMETYEAVKAMVPEALYHPLGKCITLEQKPLPKRSDRVIGIITAGTSDIPVADEAIITASIMGNEVKQIYDVGVAGIHRLFARLEEIRSCRVLIVIAGMEGALPSVIGGLVNVPVIAVPTSVGYGANFGGLSALLGMLNSCAAGVATVNIDNGFGAARLASIINHLE